VIATGDVVVGEIGEIHPETLTAWGIRTPVVAFEIDLERILELRRLGRASEPDLRQRG
jgi:phenylalanyl-tRNA synthetase beta subunit